MGEEESSVDVVFRIVPKSATLRLFKVNLWTLFDTALEDCQITKDYIVSLSKTLPNESAHAQITVIETNGKLGGAGVLFDDPRGSMPVISYSLEPLQESLYVRIRISIESTTEDANNVQVLHFYDSYDLINDLHVDYILLNKYRANEFQRFLYDSEHFTEEFQNKSIIIFKVS